MRRLFPVTLRFFIGCQGRKAIVFLLFITLVFLAPSCIFHPGSWEGSNPPGKTVATFKDFSKTNTNSIEATKGGLLVVSYAIRVTSGTVLLRIEKNKHTIWEKEFSSQSDTAEIQFPVTEKGTYTIVEKGNKASGNFDIAYKIVPPKSIQVKTSKNIELFGLILHLDNGGDFVNSSDSVVIDNRKSTWRDWYALAVENYLRYKQFDSSRMMNAYRSLQSQGLYNDFLIRFLLQVDEVPYAKISSTTDRDAILPFSKNGDEKEAEKLATAFLNLFNNFYNDVHFENYLSEKSGYYEAIKATVEKNTPDGLLLPVMENFYQKTFTAYYLVPSLNIITGLGFGVMNNNTRTIYNAFGPFSFQSFDPGHLDLGFNYPDKIRGLSVHEFGHSFVNPAIDKVRKSLIDSTAYLYLPVQAEMSKQAYTSWNACLNEHFVRAGEIIIARKMGDTQGAEMNLQRNLKGKFIYLPAIVEALEAYDRNKAQYKSYDDVVPSIIEKLKPVSDR